jgi:hypothetical protein
MILDLGIGISKTLNLKSNDCVVQLDRISDFDSEGCRFEPCRGHEYKLKCFKKSQVSLKFF